MECADQGGQQDHITKAAKRTISGLAASATGAAPAVIEAPLKVTPVTSSAPIVRPGSDCNAREALRGIGSEKVQTPAAATWRPGQQCLQRTRGGRAESTITVLAG